MDSATKPNLAQDMIGILRAHEAELRDFGIRRISLFGSVARGDFADESDVDLAVELEPSARLGLFAFVGLERRIADYLGRPVDLVPEPVEKKRLQVKINRDRLRAF